MTGYRPDQRQPKVQILTRGGWVSGTLHVPAKNAMVDYMNRPQEFFRMTDVSLQGRDAPLPFLALHRSAMMLLVPPADEEVLEQRTGGPWETKPVTCLLEFGVVDGTIDVHQGIRVSDFFQNRQGFVLIEEARLLLAGRGPDPVPAVKEERMVIHTACILGVSDVVPPHEGEAGK